MATDARVGCLVNEQLDEVLVVVLLIGAGVVPFGAIEDVEILAPKSLRRTFVEALNRSLRVASLAYSRRQRF